jgi:hypothetical protein
MNRIYLIFIFFIVLLFFLTRLPLIEKDIPPIDVSGYAQIDEPYYATLALDKYDYGDFYYNKKGTIEPHSTFLGSSFLLNASCYVTLEMFGDNYWGLRFASIIFGLIVLGLIFYSFKEIKAELSLNYRKELDWISFLLILILCADFSFLFSNIVIEPTLMRLAVTLIMVLLTNHLLKKNSSFQKIFALGILAIFSWLLVYLVNIYIPASIGIAIIVSNLSKKQPFSKNILSYSLGLCTGLLLIITVAYFLKLNLLNEIKYVYSSFGGRTSLTEGEKMVFLKSVLINGINFFKANFLNYNPILLFLFIGSTLVWITLLVKKQIKYLPSLPFTALIFLSVFFCESLLINDFFTRKLLIVYPLYLLITFGVISLFYTDTARLLSKQNWIFIVGTSTAIVLLSQYTQKWIYHCEHSALFLQTFPAYMVAFVIVLVCLFSFYINRNIFSSVSALLIMLFCNNAYYSYSFAYKRVTENFKQSMVSIAPLVKNTELIGGWSLGFRLYNESKPIINPYMYYNKGEEYVEQLEKAVAKTSKAFMVTYKNDSLVTNLKLLPRKVLVNDFCNDDFVLYQIK